MLYMTIPKHITNPNPMPNHGTVQTSALSN